MTEREALLYAICSQPEEDTPRLVYADWLQEHGQGERAEFIRAQVWLWANPSCSSCTGEEWLHGKPCAECDKRQANRVRANDLLAGDYGRNWRHWIGDGIKLVPPGNFYYDHVGFARGFVESLTCTCTDFLTHAAAIFAQHPVMSVMLVDRKPSMNTVDACESSAMAGRFESFDWWSSEMGLHSSMSGIFPREAWPLMKEMYSQHLVLGSLGVEFETDAAANDAASRVLTALGRKLAKLPAWQPATKAVTA